MVPAAEVDWLVGNPPFGFQAGLSQIVAGSLLHEFKPVPAYQLDLDGTLYRPDLKLTFSTAIAHDPKMLAAPNFSDKITEFDHYAASRIPELCFVGNDRYK